MSKQLSPIINLILCALLLLATVPFTYGQVGLLLHDTFDQLEPFTREAGFHEMTVTPDLGPVGVLRYWEPGLWVNGATCASHISVNPIGGKSDGCLSYNYSGSDNGACTQDTVSYPVGSLMNPEEGTIEFWYKPHFNQNDNSALILLLEFKKRTDIPNNLPAEYECANTCYMNFGWYGWSDRKQWVFTVGEVNDIKNGPYTYESNFGVTARTPNEFSPNRVYFEADEWLHFGLVWKHDSIVSLGGKTMLIYINGIEVASSTETFSPQFPFNERLVVGGFNGNPQGWVPSPLSAYSGASGDIDDLKIWNYAKTDAAGTVALVDQNPPLTWNYRLTYNSGSVEFWSYIGAAITGAKVDGDAQAAGWYVVSRTSSRVVFSTTTSLTSGSLTGFHITGTASGTGSWIAGTNSGGVEGALPVELSSFTGTVAQAGIILKWRTETEVNNVGFDIYRSDAKDGKYTKVNTRRISGAGTDATPHDYSFTDEGIAVGKTYYYYIKDVDFAGKTNRSHLIEVTVGKQSIKQEEVTVGKQSINPEPIPLKFGLLQNYPNPFNPETWIPYELAADAPVSISIYNLQGQLVRRLDIGKQGVGRYITKDKAAYWDGKTKLGEKVASGVYWYRLQAGEFSAMRRMIIIK